MNRRTFLGSAAGSLVAAAPAKRPNILLIFADDLGFSDLGCYGGEIRTPNLDRLAQQGVKFTQFYNTARCCPSRASILTGLYSHQANMGYMTDPWAKELRDKVASPRYSDALSKSTPTIAEALRPAGYRTGMAGKWHLGGGPGQPKSRGFDRSFALAGGAMNYFGHGNMGAAGNPPLLLREDERFDIPEREFYATDAFSDYASNFVREHRSSDPFFFYLAFNAPHWPLHAPREEIDAYRETYRAGWDAIAAQRRERQIELKLIDPKWRPVPRDPAIPLWNSLPAATRENWTLRMSVFAAMVNRLDSGVGKVLTALEKSGAAQNTLVMFVSDNGGAAEDPSGGKLVETIGTRESFAGYGRPWARVSNTPFRSYKVTTYEGGISTPFIARWPEGGLANGRLQASSAGHLIDIMPTCLDVGRASLPPLFHGERPLPAEGVSLFPALRGQALLDRTLYWEHEGYRAARRGQWKAVARHGGDWELYRVDRDRTEQENLIQQESAKANELTASWVAWSRRCGVEPWPGPIKNL